MLRRNSLNKLKGWKSSANRKPLLIRGARQVGKTTLVKMLAAEYDNYLELNLEKSGDKQLFSSEDTSQILSAAYLLKSISPKKGNTLLFIDEIQESVEAIKMLRYFYEEKPEIHVIAAGSLLEFALEKVANFPVGRVDYLYLHPMNFDEYLKSIENEQALKALNELPIPSYAQNILLEHFHEYCLIGGMPEIVAHYKENKDVISLSKLYKNLWISYKDDVEKYAKNSSEKNIIRHVIDSAPHEKDRIKFEKFGNSNYRSREVGDALRALDLSKIIRLLYPSTSLSPPIVTDYKKSPRLQFLDTGMLNQILNLQSGMIGLKDLSDFHTGKIIQHIVTQELISLYDDIDYKPNFWVREKRDSDAEVDLVYSHGKHIIPIEIKSGKSGRLKSLHQFVERSDHPYAIRMYAGEFKVEEHNTPIGKKPYFLMNLPYFLGTRIPEYVEYFLQHYS